MYWDISIPLQPLLVPVDFGDNYVFCIKELHNYVYKAATFHKLIHEITNIRVVQYFPQMNFYVLGVELYDDAPG